MIGPNAHRVFQRDAEGWKRLLLRGTLPNVEARLISSWLRRSQRIDAVPILDEEEALAFGAGQPGDRRADVLRVVLKRLPMPDDATPWEEIVQFRQDEQVIGARVDMRNWLGEMARSELSAAEIEDKCDWLLSRYERHMRLYKMKYDLGVVEAVVATTAELVENLAKLRFRATSRRASAGRRSAGPSDRASYATWPSSSATAGTLRRSPP